MARSSDVINYLSCLLSILKCVCGTRAAVHYKEDLSVTCRVGYYMAT